MPQQLGLRPLRHAVFANQGAHDPCLFQQVDTVSQAVQAVDGGLRRFWISVDQACVERVQPRHLLGCFHTFEAVDEDPGGSSRQYHQRRDLAIAAQRLNHCLAGLRGGLQAQRGVPLIELVNRKLAHFRRVRHGIAPTATNASSLPVFRGTRYPFADPAMSATLNGGERQPQYRRLKDLANLATCGMSRAARFWAVASATRAGARATRLDGTRNYRTFVGVTGCYR